MATFLTSWQVGKIARPPNTRAQLMAWTLAMCRGKLQAWLFKSVGLEGHELRGGRLGPARLARCRDPNERLSLARYAKRREQSVEPADIEDFLVREPHDGGPRDAEPGLAPPLPQNRVMHPLRTGHLGVHVLLDPIELPDDKAILGMWPDEVSIVATS